MSERPEVDPIDYLLADLHRVLCGEGVHMGPCPNPLAEQVLHRPSTRIWLERVVSGARADERENWEPMVQALTDELLAKDQPPDPSMGAQYLAGVKAARDAVAATELRVLHAKGDALAAIDGLGASESPL
jgi:hypothetical protein